MDDKNSERCQDGRVRKRMPQVSFAQPEFLKVLRDIAGSTKALAELFSIIYPEKKAWVQTLGNRIRENRGLTEEELSGFSQAMILKEREEFRIFVENVKTTYIFIDNLLQREMIKIPGINEELKRAPLTEEERKYWDGIYGELFDATEEVVRYWEEEPSEPPAKERTLIQEEIMERAEEIVNETRKKVEVDDILMRMLALNQTQPKEEPKEEEPEEEPKQEEPKEEAKDYVESFMEGGRNSRSGGSPSVIQTASSDPFDSGLASIPDVFDAQERRF